MSWYHQPMTTGRAETLATRDWCATVDQVKGILSSNVQRANCGVTEWQKVHSGNCRDLCNVIANAC